jgi:hypothetical protein
MGQVRLVKVELRNLTVWIVEEYSRLLIKEST